MQVGKKHLFAVLLASAFILPVAVFPKQSGQVMGINEVKNENNEVLMGQLDAGDIASGARDVAKKDPITDQQSVFGKALWDSKQKVKVSTNKFSSGSSVKITYNGKSVVLLVEAQRDDLSQDTVLILNTEAFLEVGANPETQSAVDVEVLSVE